MQASLPALVAHQAIDVLCVIMSHGFRYHTVNSLELERTSEYHLFQSEEYFGISASCAVLPA